MAAAAAARLPLEGAIAASCGRKPASPGCTLCPTADVIRTIADLSLLPSASGDDDDVTVLPIRLSMENFDVEVDVGGDVDVVHDGDVDVGDGDVVGDVIDLSSSWLPSGDTVLDALPSPLAAAARALRLFDIVLVSSFGLGIIWTPPANPGNPGNPEQNCRRSREPGWRRETGAGGNGDM